MWVFALFSFPLHLLFSPSLTPRPLFLVLQSKKRVRYACLRRDRTETQVGWRGERDEEIGSRSVVSFEGCMD